MNTVSEDQTPVATLRAALRDFYDDYGACLDDMNLEAWVDFFTDDCHYRVISQENMQANLPLGLIYCMNKNMLMDRVTAIRETTMYEPRMLRHFISGVRVNSVEGDVIKAQANFMITEALSDQEPTLNLVGQYQDVIVRTSDGFLLQSRDCVYDNYRIRNSMIVPV
ncbi:MAG: aromatic-ring-hydroxylating dioxygenase subunit beta [Burkholderiaceae bacterium]|nr:aromatic-ring-hydroxylating dioxygenase subunit beta [Burkholderiaceae bacterium]